MGTGHRRVSTCGVPDFCQACSRPLFTVSQYCGKPNEQGQLSSVPPPNLTSLPSFLGFLTFLSFSGAQVLLPLFYLKSTLTWKFHPWAWHFCQLRNHKLLLLAFKYATFEYELFKYSNRIPAHFPPLFLSMQQMILFPSLRLFLHTTMNFSLPSARWPLPSWPSAASHLNTKLSSFQLAVFSLECSPHQTGSFLMQDSFTQKKWPKRNSKSDPILPHSVNSLYTNMSGM